MKTTAQRLSEVYCRPKKHEWKEVLTWDEHLTKSLPIVSWDWAMDGKCYPISRTENHYTLKDRTEIPVTHFIDLLHDKIVPWRLEEDEFITEEHNNSPRSIFIDRSTVYIKNGAMINRGLVTVKFVPFPGCKTYTDLITLIKLIG
jgi:hypothetical protein